MLRQIDSALQKYQLLIPPFYFDCIQKLRALQLAITTHSQIVVIIALEAQSLNKGWWAACSCSNLHTAALVHFRQQELDSVVQACEAKDPLTMAVALLSGLRGAAPGMLAAWAALSARFLAPCRALRPLTAGRSFCSLLSSPSVCSGTALVSLCRHSC